MTHVLVVEDDPFIARKLQRQLISQSACQVVLATTVAEALALLEPPPDWITLDMNLPDGSGLTVLVAIRNAGHPTRVVVSSATDDATLIAAVEAHKPDFIMPKPLDLARLPIGQDERP